MMDFTAFGMQPRGLHNFISEIRNSKSKEEETQRVDKELANIRQKFSTTANLSSYDKKKYIWKLCYIYMLGYEVEFGHVEFISLLSSTKYQEKSVGYMAFSMMFRPGDELMSLGVNSMRNDLVGPYLHGQTLALAAVSNMGGTDLAQALAGDVERLVSTDTPAYMMQGDVETALHNKSLLTKKAALCLLRLYRTNPECVNLQEWCTRFVKLLEDRDLGVITSVMSLLLGFASSAPIVFEPLVPYVISILNRLVVQRTCPQDYHYYQIPSPWLQVKCIRFLQYFRIPDDSTQLELLNEVLNKILVRPETNNESNNKNNAVHAILFEAINLLILYGPDCPAHLGEIVVGLLGKFIEVHDANVRYLGIDAMTRLAKINGPEVAEHHQVAVLDALKETDISLRKKALNLLYVMTYESNAKEIVGEIMVILPLADASLKEDMVVKIAIVAEKYSKDLSWYVDTMVQIILMAGDYVTEPVWYRMVQIIFNNPAVHDYAAEKLLACVQSKYTHDIIISIAGYLLGEIGVNICEQPNMTGYDQFIALNQHFANASYKVKALLLTTYVKLLNLYSDQIRDLVIEVFQKYSTSSVLELQQRACEYLALSTQISPQIAQYVLDKIPDFPINNRENILLTVENSQKATADRPASAVDATEKAASRAATTTTKEQRSNTVTSNNNKPVASVAPQKSIDLLSLDDDFNDNFNISGGSANSLTPELVKVVQRNAYAAALVKGLTVKSPFYTNSFVEISVASDYRNHQGRVVLFILNKSSHEIHNVAMELASPAIDQQLIHVRTQLTGTSVPVGGEVRVQVAIESLRPFEAAVIGKLSFSFSGSAYSYDLPLPIFVSNFCVPLPSDKNTYMGRWKAISGEKTESQQVFTGAKPITADMMKYIQTVFMPTINVGNVEGIDTDKTFTGSCTFMTGTTGADGKPVGVGALLRLEGEPNANKYRVTVRSTHPVVSTAIKDFIVHQLA